jgi:hypothetical protein
MHTIACTSTEQQGGNPSLTPAPAAAMPTTATAHLSPPPTPQQQKRKRRGKALKRPVIIYATASHGKQNTNTEKR